MVERQSIGGRLASRRRRSAFAPHTLKQPATIDPDRLRTGPSIVCRRGRYLGNVLPHTCLGLGQVHDLENSSLLDPGLACSRSVGRCRCEVLELDPRRPDRFQHPRRFTHCFDPSIELRDVGELTSCRLQLVLKLDDAPLGFGRAIAVFCSELPLGGGALPCLVAFPLQARRASGSSSHPRHLIGKRFEILLESLRSEAKLGQLRQPCSKFRLDAREPILISHRLGRQAVLALARLLQQQPECLDPLERGVTPIGRVAGVRKGTLVVGHQGADLCAKRSDTRREPFCAEDESMLEGIYGHLRPDSLDTLSHPRSMLRPPIGPAQVPEVGRSGHPT
jgi:hypothetical protein